MAIILSFFTREQLCEDCARQHSHDARQCVSCQDKALETALHAAFDEQLPERHDRLVLDSAAE